MNKMKRSLLSLRERYYRSNYQNALPGTRKWLISTEIRYGGIQVNVPRNRVSSKDPRTPEQLGKGGMIGGDRMLHHGYAPKYSECLLPYIEKGEPVTLAEFGILRGTGMAIWCDLFRNGRVLGFDIDLGHINENMSNLKSLGAFERNQPELHEFDQFLDNTEYLGTIFGDEKIDICIDDGAHCTETILNTIRSAMPYLADEFVYFIEDNKTVHKEIRILYPDLLVENEGELTIVTRSKAWTA